MAAQAPNSYGGKMQHQAKSASQLSCEYKDLTRSDLSCLAEILTPPPRDATATTSFNQATKAMIVRLPKTLRCRHSWLSTFCTQHKKLNPLPIIHLWRWLRHTVEEELDRTLLLLRLAGKTSTELAWFAEALRTHDWRDSGCEACSVVAIAKQDMLVIAIAAIHLAVLPPRNWRKSKRVYFLEQLLHGRSRSRDGEASVVKIYSLGSQLHQLRNHAGHTTNRSEDGTNEGTQHQVVNESLHIDDDETTPVVPTEASSGAAPTDPQHLHNPPWAATAFSAGYDGRLASTIPYQTARSNDHEEAMRIPDNVEDIFADSVAGTESLETGSIMIANDIQDLFDDEPAPVDPIWKFRPVSRASQRLDNVWLPRTKYGGAALRSESLLPVLRKGRNGEIKGPFDPTSRSTLEGIHEGYEQR